VQEKRERISHQIWSGDLGSLNCRISCIIHSGWCTERASRVLRILHFAYQSLSSSTVPSGHPIMATLSCAGPWPRSFRTSGWFEQQPKTWSSCRRSGIWTSPRRKAVSLAVQLKTAWPDSLFLPVADIFTSPFARDSSSAVVVGVSGQGATTQRAYRSSAPSKAVCPEPWHRHCELES
jgi:hypothetical protein